MKTIPTTDADYNLWLLLSQTRHAIFRIRQKELDQYNISTRQSALLLALKTIGDKAKPSEIARWLLREPHSISEQLSRMEKAGLVKKAKDLDRKNLVRVELTEKGREALYHASKRESIHEILSSLSKEEKQQLGSSLQKLRVTALEELGIKKDLIFPPAQ